MGPLSHELSMTSPEVPERRGEVVAGSPAPTISLAAVLRSVTVRHPFPAALTAGVVVLMLARPLMHVAGVVPALVGLTAGAATIALVLWVAGVTLTGFLRRQGAVIRALLVVSVYLLAGLLAGLVGVPLLRPEAETRYRLLWVALIVLVALIAVVLASLAAVGHQWRVVESQLQAATAATRHEANRLQAELNALRTKVADFLHADVQGGLIAASMALGRVAGPSTPAERAAAWEQARSMVAVAEHQLATILEGGSASEAPTVGQGLDGIESAWSDGIDLTISVDADVVALTGGSEAAVILEAVQEGVVNAVRHGMAATVTVHITRADGQVTVIIDDDGAGPRDHWRAGHGLTTLSNRAEVELGDSPLMSGARLRVKLRDRVSVTPPPLPRNREPGRHSDD